MADDVFPNYSIETMVDPVTHDVIVRITTRMRPEEIMDNPSIQFMLDRRDFVGGALSGRH